MTKEFLIKIFNVFSVALISLIAMAGLVIFITANTVTIRGIGIGITAGVIIGGVIKIKYQIPRMFKNKDERTLVITLLASLISESVFAVMSYLCFVLTATGVFIFDKESSTKMLIYVAVIVLSTILVDKIVYKVLCRKL